MALAKKFIYLLLQMLFLAGCALTLLGLAFNQHWCSDDAVGDEAAALFTFANSRSLGGSCRSFFRLPWFVLALNGLPVLLSFVAMFKPEYAHGATTAFYAAVAPLDILMAHAWYDMVDVGDFIGGTDETWFKVTLAGWCLKAAGCLLLLLSDSLLMSAKHEHNERKSGVPYDTGAPAAPQRSASPEDRRLEAKPMPYQSRPTQHVAVDVEPPVVTRRPEFHGGEPLSAPQAQRGYGMPAAPQQQPQQQAMDYDTRIVDAGTPGLRQDQVVGYVVREPAGTAGAGTGTAQRPMM